MQFVSSAEAVFSDIEYAALEVLAPFETIVARGKYESSLSARTSATNSSGGGEGGDTWSSAIRSNSSIITEETVGILLEECVKAAFVDSLTGSVLAAERCASSSLMTRATTSFSGAAARDVIARLPRKSILLTPACAVVSFWERRQDADAFCDSYRVLRQHLAASTYRSCLAQTLFCGSFMVAGAGGVCATAVYLPPVRQRVDREMLASLRLLKEQQQVVSSDGAAGGDSPNRNKTGKTSNAKKHEQERFVPIDEDEEEEKKQMLLKLERQLLKPRAWLELICEVLSEPVEENRPTAARASAAVQDERRDFSVLDGVSGVPVVVRPPRWCLTAAMAQKQGAAAAETETTGALVETIPLMVSALKTSLRTIVLSPQTVEDLDGISRRRAWQTLRERIGKCLEEHHLDASSNEHGSGEQEDQNNDTTSVAAALMRELGICCESSCAAAGPKLQLLEKPQPTMNNSSSPRRLITSSAAAPAAAVTVGKFDESTPAAAATAAGSRLKHRIWQAAWMEDRNDPSSLPLHAVLSTASWWRWEKLKKEDAAATTTVDEQEQEERRVVDPINSAFIAERRDIEESLTRLFFSFPQKQQQQQQQQQEDLRDDDHAATNLETPLLFHENRCSADTCDIDDNCGWFRLHRSAMEYANRLFNSTASTLGPVPVFRCDPAWAAAAVLMLKFVANELDRAQHHAQMHLSKTHILAGGAALPSLLCSIHSLAARLLLYDGTKQPRLVQQQIRRHRVEAAFGGSARSSSSIRHRKIIAQLQQQDLDEELQQNVLNELHVGRSAVLSCFLRYDVAMSSSGSSSESGPSTPRRRREAASGFLQRCLLDALLGRIIPDELSRYSSHPSHAENMAESVSAVVEQGEDFESNAIKALASQADRPAVVDSAQCRLHRLERCAILPLAYSAVKTLFGAHFRAAEMLSSLLAFRYSPLLTLVLSQELSERLRIKRAELDFPTMPAVAFTRERLLCSGFSMLCLLCPSLDFLQQFNVVLQQQQQRSRSASRETSVASEMTTTSASSAIAGGGRRGDSAAPTSVVGSTAVAKDHAGLIVVCTDRLRRLLNKILKFGDEQQQQQQQQQRPSLSALLLEELPICILSASTLLRRCDPEFGSTTAGTSTRDHALIFVMSVAVNCARNTQRARNAAASRIQRFVRTDDDIMSRAAALKKRRTFEKEVRAHKTKSSVLQWKIAQLSAGRESTLIDAESGALRCRELTGVVAAPEPNAPAVLENQTPSSFATPQPQQQEQQHQQEQKSTSAALSFEGQELPHLQLLMDVRREFRNVAEVLEEERHELAHSVATRVLASLIADTLPGEAPPLSFLDIFLRRSPSPSQDHHGLNPQHHEQSQLLSPSVRTALRFDDEDHAESDAANAASNYANTIREQRRGGGGRGDAAAVVPDDGLDQTQQRQFSISTGLEDSALLPDANLSSTADAFVPGLNASSATSGKRSHRRNHVSVREQAELMRKKLQGTENEVSAVPHLNIEKAEALNKEEAELREHLETVLEADDWAHLATFIVDEIERITWPPERRAALKIQCAWRSFVARTELRTVILQRLYFGTSAAKDSKADDDEEF